MTMKGVPIVRVRETVEELYLVGTHLEQYLHPTWEPEPYYREALKRDPGESRVNTALGRMALRRGEWDCAERHFRAAIRRLTAWNGNPRDGEAHYYLGQTLRHQGRHEEAYDVLAKSAWCAASDGMRLPRRACAVGYGPEPRGGGHLAAGLGVGSPSRRRPRTPA